MVHFQREAVRETPVSDHRPEAPRSTWSCVARSMSFPKAVDAKTPDVLSKNGSKVKIVQVPRINPSARTRHNEPALIRRQLFLAAPNAPSLDRCRARTAGGIQPALGDNQGDKAKHKDIPPALKGLTTLAKIPFGSLRHCLAAMACRQPNALGGAGRGDCALADGASRVFAWCHRLGKAVRQIRTNLTFRKSPGLALVTLPNSTHSTQS